MSSIETERLFFRLYTEQDKSGFVELLTDPDVMRYVDRGVSTVFEAEELWQQLMKERYPQGVDTIWAVFAKDDMRYIGNAAVRPRPERRSDWEISYYLKTAEWGKGYATEIAQRLVRYAFGELDLAEVYATVFPANLASRKVLEKAGLRLFRKEFDDQGMFYVYRAAREDAAGVDDQPGPRRLIS